MKPARFFGVVNHSLCYSVLNRACRVKILKFGKNFCLKIQILFDMRQLKKRGFSDKLIGRCKNISHSIIPPLVSDSFKALL